jgi:aspartate/methionine/tyrosine aminotransferase
VSCKPAIHSPGHNDPHAFVAAFAGDNRYVLDYLTEESGLPFEEKHVVMTVGAAGGLNVVFKALLDEGDEVIVPSPYFMEFKFILKIVAGRFGWWIPMRTFL